MSSLQIQSLRVSVEGKTILNDLSLEVPRGELHVIMGPNGSGKSTLAYALLGHPKYVHDAGRILVDGEDIGELGPDERARKGLFLSFQHPPAIPGLTVESFLRTAYNASSGKNLDVVQFHKLLAAKLDLLRIDRSFARRYLNDGFSGGERKRMEILQMLILDPAFPVLDETDSGLDVDALRVVAQGIGTLRDQNHGILVITHFNRILHYLKPDKVHILKDGKIVRSGGPELAHEIETKGYE
jgi:Fe-S cluster assembly ATP-binding protein